MTHRRVLLLALPMTLSNVTTPLLGFVGAAVIGRLGDPALLGAVALGALLFDVIFWTFGALRMATAGLTAQATGAGDVREVDRTLARSLFAGGAIGLSLVVLQWPIARLAFALAGASPEVTQALATYFHIRIFCAPFTLGNYAILGSVLGRGRTDLGLVLQVAINAATIVLTLFLVLGCGLGVAGAATAALLGEIAGFGLGLLVLARLGSRPFSVAWAEIRDSAAIARTVAVNGDIMIRTVAIVAALSIFASLGARAGDVTLAANAVLQNLFMIGGFFLDGFATAAETLCGQAVGARDEAGFRRAARFSLGWCFGFGFAVSALFLVGGSAFIDLVTVSPEVRAFARDHLVFAALAPLFAAGAFAYDGIFIGATWTRSMRDLMIAAFLTYLVVLVATLGLGNSGLWIAFLVFLAARGIGQAVLYPRLARRTFPGTAPAHPARLGIETS